MAADGLAGGVPVTTVPGGDTTKVSWHTASGWTANMSANTQFGNELAGWPDRVRMFAGDQAYTTSTARVFTASGIFDQEDLCDKLNRFSLGLS